MAKRKVIKKADSVQDVPYQSRNSDIEARIIERQKYLESLLSYLQLVQTATIFISRPALSYRRSVTSQCDEAVLWSTPIRLSFSVSTG